MADFATPQDVADLLQITITEDQAELIETDLLFADSVIRNYTRQHISFVAGDIVTVETNGSSRMFLPQLPVVSVANVWENGTPLEQSSFFVNAGIGILNRRGRVWCRGFNVYEVEYSHGHINIPADIAGIAAGIAARRYQAGLRSRANDGVLGVASKSLGDFAVSYGSESSSDEGQLGVTSGFPLLRNEMAILDGYKIYQTWSLIEQY